MWKEILIIAGYGFRVMCGGAIAVIPFVALAILITKMVGAE